MIDSIIEDSYRKKIKIRKKIPIEETEKTELFHQIKQEKFKPSSLINYRVKHAKSTINSSIDDLLSYSFINSDSKFIREQLEKRRRMVESEPHIENDKLKNKYLFKGDFTLSDKLRKTVVKEFSFANKFKKNNFLTIDNYTKNISKKIQNPKNKTNQKFKNNSLVYKYDPETSKFKISSKNQNLKMSKDSLFITKLPKKIFHPDKTTIIPNSLTTRKLLPREEKLRKIGNLIKESNSKMLDIYTGLKNIKENRTISLDHITNYASQPKTQNISINNNNIKIRTRRKLRNIDKFLNLDLQKSQSLGSINRKFKNIFQKIFENKELSNEKFDPRLYIHPFDNIVKGAYKEIKLDNRINHSLGRRIWIQKSTANIVSYGKSCEQIDDDIFYKERKRIISIYPKIEEEAKIPVFKKKINKKNPLFKRLIENVNKINDVFLEEYKLLKKIKIKRSENKNK